MLVYIVQWLAFVTIVLDHTEKCDIFKMLLLDVVIDFMGAAAR